MKCSNRFFAIVLILAVAVGQAPLLAQAQQGKTIYCPYCGFLNQATHKFCYACGASLPGTLTNEATMAEATAPSNKLEPSAPASADVNEETQAQLLYETGFDFIQQGAYDQAAKYFRRVMKEHPASTYAQESERLAKACDQLALAKATAAPKPVKSGSSSGAAFSGAFVGGALGTLGGLLLLIAMASGG
jgi:hypothetical protein